MLPELHYGAFLHFSCALLHHRNVCISLKLYMKSGSYYISIYIFILVTTRLCEFIFATIVLNVKFHVLEPEIWTYKCCDARKRPALELARPHPQNGRASPYPTSPTTVHCVKPTPESIHGDVSGLEIQAAINLAKERVEWKKNRPSRRC